MTVVALGHLVSAAVTVAEALAAYEASLETWPKRYNSLLGAARAASRAASRMARQRGASRWYGTGSRTSRL